MLWLQIIMAWEAIRSEFLGELFGSVAFMTRYGHIGYDEAMSIPRWERGRYCDALAKLIDEQNSSSGLQGLSDD